MRPSEILTCDDVTLRRWRPADAELVCRLVRESIDHLSPWMPWATAAYDHAAAAEFMARSHAMWESGEEFDYAIVSPAGHEVGSCGLMARVGPGGLEIGYWLHPAHTGMGIATKAVTALAAEAFRIGADHVEIQHDAGNVRSGAIPRRLGFTHVERRLADDGRPWLGWRLRRDARPLT